MEPKHTQDLAVYSTKIGCVSTGDIIGEALFKMQAHQSLPSVEEAQANAKLWAASPALLKALKKAVLLYYIRLDVTARLREQEVPVGTYVPGKAEWVTIAEVAIAEATT